MTIINFPNCASFVNNRPYADIILNPSHRNSPTHKCLVDTGADFLQLPMSAVTASGLRTSSASRHTILTAGTSASMLRIDNIPAEIEGYSVTVTVLLDPTNQAPPLAGRGILLAAFDVGFQPAAWHWT